MRNRLAIGALVLTAWAANAAPGDKLYVAGNNVNVRSAPAHKTRIRYNNAVAPCGSNVVPTPWQDSHAVVGAARAPMRAVLSVSASVRCSA